MASNAKKDDGKKDIEQHKREMLSTLIGEQILHNLGRPGALLKVQVRSVFDNCYRANIIVGATVDDCRIAHSYFLTADAEGKITDSTPSIVKLYA